MWNSSFAAARCRVRAGGVRPVPQPTPQPTPQPAPRAPALSRHHRRHRRRHDSGHRHRRRRRNHRRHHRRQRRRHDSGHGHRRRHRHRRRRRNHRRRGSVQPSPQQKRKNADSKQRELTVSGSRRRLRMRTRGTRGRWLMHHGTCSRRRCRERRHSPHLSRRQPTPATTATGASGDLVFGLAPTHRHADLREDAVLAHTSTCPLRVVLNVCCSLAS